MNEARIYLEVNFLIRANKKQMKFIQYIKDSFGELSNHMTWVSMPEAQKTTVTVAVFTIIFALAVAGVDYVFQSGLDNFFTLF
jgi:preprotein translocase subunit SecE